MLNSKFFIAGGLRRKLTMKNRGFSLNSDFVKTATILLLSQDLIFQKFLFIAVSFLW